MMTSPPCHQQPNIRAAANRDDDDSNGRDNDGDDGRGPHHHHFARTSAAVADHDDSSTPPSRASAILPADEADGSPRDEEGQDGTSTITVTERNGGEDASTAIIGAAAAFSSTTAMTLEDVFLLDRAASSFGRSVLPESPSDNAIGTDNGHDHGSGTATHSRHRNALRGEEDQEFSAFPYHHHHMMMFLPPEEHQIGPEDHYGHGGPHDDSIGRYPIDLSPLLLPDQQYGRADFRMEDIIDNVLEIVNSDFPNGDDCNWSEEEEEEENSNVNTVDHRSSWW